MTDANIKDDVILVNSSITEETTLDENKDSQDSNVEKEGLLKEIKLEREKRHQVEEKMASLESKLENNAPTPNSEDLDLDLIADKLSPTLKKLGFVTKQEQEDESRANKYAQDLQNLSAKYDGNDGRPIFDAGEVAEHAKRTGIFNLEAAYRDLYWSEIVDFERKQTTSDNIETEKPNSTNQSKPGERVLLTREYLNKRLKEPDGKAWFDKNHEKIMAAMAKGQL